MREPAIRTRRGHLARLVRDARRPRSAALRRARATSAAGQRASRRSAAPARARARRQTKPSGTRLRAKRFGEAAPRAAHAIAPGRRTPAGSDTRPPVAAAARRREHLVDPDVEQTHALAACSAAGDGTRTRRRARRSRPPAATGRCARDASDRRCPTIGVPTAAPMCVGPVSPDTITAAPRASATMSAIDVCGESRPRRRRAPRPLRRARARPVPRARPTSARAARAAPRASSAEARRRPPLVRPRGAGVEQRIAAAGPLAHLAAPPPSRPCSIGNSGRAGRDAERLEQTRG